jgi:hypothetical protein
MEVRHDRGRAGQYSFLRRIKAALRRRPVAVGEGHEPADDRCGREALEPDLLGRRAHWPQERAPLRGTHRGPSRPRWLCDHARLRCQVDWYRNLLAAGGGTIRWRDREYLVGTPVRIDPAAGLAAFHPIQRLLLRIAGVSGYVRVADARAAGR